MLQHLVRNTIWRSLADVIARLGSALFWILLARLSGAGFFGAISFALALLGFFELISSLGLGSVLTRDAAQEPAKAGGYFGHMLVIGMVSAVAGGVLMVASAWAIRPDPDTMRMVVILALLLPLTSVAYWSKAMLTAAEKMHFISLGTMTENSILIVLGMALLLTGHGLLAVAAALALSKGISALLLYYLARAKVVRPDWHLDRGTLSYLLHQAPLFLLIAFFNALFWSITVILVTWFQGEVAAGYFSAAYKLISYALLFAIAFSQALFPVAAKLAQQDRPLYRQLLQRALHYMMLLFLGIAIFLSLLAEPIILLLYGPGLAGSIPVLRWLAWMVLPYGLIPALAYTLISHHQPHRDMWANLAGALTVVGANIILIPRFSATGAAIAMVAGAGVFAAVEYRSVHGLLYALRPDRRTLAVVISAGLLVLTLMGLREVHPLLCALAGSVVYLSALWIFRAIDWRDIVQIGHALWPRRKERMA